MRDRASSKMVESELGNVKRSLFKMTAENRKLVQENTVLRNILENAPIEQIQGLRAEKAKEQQRGRERDPGRGFSR